MSQKNTAVIKQNNKPLRGRLRVPSDKSITQRAYIFGAMAEGITTVNNPLNSADAEATLAAVISLGAELISQTETQVVLRGVGNKGFTAPAIYFGNNFNAYISNPVSLSSVIVIAIQMS